MSGDVVRLWRRRPEDCGHDLKELARGMFSDDDAFQRAVEHAQSEGFHEDREE